MILPINKQEAGSLRRSLWSTLETLKLQVAGVYQNFGYNWDQDVYFPQRQKVLQWHIANDLSILSEQIEFTILTSGEQAFRIGYYLSAYLLGLDNFTRPSHQYIAGILNQPYINATPHDRISDLIEQFYTRLRKEMVTSQLETDTLPQAIRRLAQIFGLTDESGFMGSIIRIQSSELWRSANRGTMEAMRDHQELIDGVSWDTAENEQVCKICGPLHGKTVPFGQAFKIGKYDTQFSPIHVGCNCTVYPKTNNPPRLSLLDWLRLNFITSEESGGLNVSH